MSGTAVKVSATATTRPSNSEESAAEELRGQAEELAAIVATFSLTNAGGGVPESHSPTGRPVKPARVQPQAAIPKASGHNGHGPKPALRRLNSQAGVNRISKDTRSARPETVIPLDDDDLREF